MTWFRPYKLREFRPDVRYTADDAISGVHRLATCILMLTSTNMLLQPASAASECGTVKLLFSDAAGPVTLELYEALTAIQQERAVDDMGWVVPI